MEENPSSLPPTTGGYYSIWKKPKSIPYKGGGRVLLKGVRLLKSWAELYKTRKQREANKFLFTSTLMKSPARASTLYRTPEWVPWLSPPSEQEPWYSS